jgi:hypothetical protein
MDQKVPGKQQAKLQNNSIYMEVSVNADTYVPLTERIYDSLRKEVFDSFHKDK